MLEFVQGTQADEWAKLVAHYAGSAEDEFFTQLDRALKQRGMLDVLRNGLKLVPGVKFALCAFKPASGLNAELNRLFAANILSVIRQVRYSLKNENAIDVVLFVNGLPVATLELKNLMTGSTFRHAEKQYKYDRPPANEPLLTFKRGALVHFALDEDNVSMTPRLQNGNPPLNNTFNFAQLIRLIHGLRRDFVKLWMNEKSSPLFVPQEQNMVVQMPIA